MEPVMCLFMRTDMTSMNAGKMAAQTAHGATMLEKNALKYTTGMELNLMHENWSASTPSGFGTKYVFGVDQDQMDDVMLLHLANAFGTSDAGVIHDPTYPIRDGKITHYIPIDTGCWVFFDSEKIQGSVISFFRKKGIHLMD